MPRGRSRGGKSRASSKRKGPRNVNVTVDYGGAGYEEMGTAQGYHEIEESTYNPYSGYGEVYEESFIPTIFQEEVVYPTIFQEEIYYLPTPPPRIVQQDVINYNHVEYTQPVTRAVEVVREHVVPEIVDVIREKTVPKFVEKIVQVPKREIEYKYVDVPKIETKVVDKLVEKPEIRYVDKPVAGKIVYQDIYENN